MRPQLSTKSYSPYCILCEHNIGLWNITKTVRLCTKCYVTAMRLLDREKVTVSTETIVKKVSECLAKRGKTIDTTITD